MRIATLTEEERKEHIRMSKKKWRLENKEKVREANRRYDQKYREKRNAANAEYQRNIRKFYREHKHCQTSITNENIQVNSQEERIEEEIKEMVPESS